MKFGESFNRLLSIWLIVIVICVSFVIISRENQPTKEDLVSACIKDCRNYYRLIDSLIYMHEPDSVIKYYDAILDTADLHNHTREEYHKCFRLLCDTSYDNAYFANELICKLMAEREIKRWDYVNGFIFSSLTYTGPNTVVCVGFMNKIYMASKAPWRVAYEETLNTMMDGSYYLEEAIDTAKFKNSAEESAYVYFAEATYTMVYKDSLNIWKYRLRAGFY